MRSRFLLVLSVVAVIVAAFVFGLSVVAAKYGVLAAVGAYLVVDSLFRVPAFSARLGLITQIADLWTPAIWIPGMAERVVTRPSLLNSGAVVRDPLLDEIATGGGVQGVMPFLKELDGDETPQVEDTAPTPQKMGSGQQICPILNREVAVAFTALARAVAAATPGAQARGPVDPVQLCLDVLSDWRLRRRQRALVNALRGFFATAAAANSEDHFLETTVGLDSGLHYIKSSFINAALARLGENKEAMIYGAMVCHSVIENALLNQDEIEVIRNSDGKIILRTYKGMPVFVSDTLSRAGTTSGTVYETYFFLPGSVGMGDKPQSDQIGDVSSLLVDGDAAKNNLTIYDRTRYLLHPVGARWTGTPAAQSATNAELATAGNWALAYGDVKNVGIVRVRTNG